jgi:hypothetical protein
MSQQPDEFIKLFLIDIDNKHDSDEQTMAVQLPDPLPESSTTIAESALAEFFSFPGKDK